jgi:hypothetical protein
MKRADTLTQNDAEKIVHLYATDCPVRDVLPVVRSDPATLGGLFCDDLQTLHEP